MKTLRIGVLLEPQYTTFRAYAEAVRQVESLGVDTVWNYDHFIPPYGTHKGNHLEAWTLLSAMAMLTSRVEIGCLVTCNSYRNPNLLANMAKTVDHVSGGRLILGIGAGWFEREYREYGYTFGTARERIEALGTALPQIKRRWQAELPRPVRNPIPILIGGEGEQMMLKLVAQHADIWNGWGTAERYRSKCAVLDRWCAEVGRNPDDIERSAMTPAHTARTLDPLVEAGAGHIIMTMRAPCKFGSVEKLVRWRDTRR